MENPNKRYQEMVKKAQQEAQNSIPPLSSFEERKRVWDEAKEKQSAKFDPKNLEQKELFAQYKNHGNMVFVLSKKKITLSLLKVCQKIEI